MWLDRDLRGEDNLLLLQRTQVQFLTPIIRCLELCLELTFRGANTLFWPLWTPVWTWCIHRKAGTYIHMSKNNHYGSNNKQLAALSQSCVWWPILVKTPGKKEGASTENCLHQSARGCLCAFPWSNRCRRNQLSISSVITGHVSTGWQEAQHAPQSKPVSLHGLCFRSCLSSSGCFCPECFITALGKQTRKACMQFAHKQWWWQPHSRVEQWGMDSPWWSQSLVSTPQVCHSAVLTLMQVVAPPVNWTQHPIRL